MLPTALPIIGLMVAFAACSRGPEEGRTIVKADSKAKDSITLDPRTAANAEPIALPRPNGNQIPGTSSDPDPSSGIEWVMSSGDIPVKAVPFGRIEGVTTYLCRVAIDGDKATGPLLPGKACAITVDGKRSEYSKDFEVFVINGDASAILQESKATGGEIPEGSLAVGSLKKQPLYVCRHDNSDGTQSVGKIAPGFTSCSTFTSTGETSRNEDYWVLRVGE